MDILVLNKEMESIHIIDEFESMIWVERYSKCGDFELYLPIEYEIISYIKNGYYLWLESSKTVMIIEDIEIVTDNEEGNHMIVTGRSLESILDRRILWEQTILSGGLQSAVEQILLENIISPSIPDRSISNFIFEASDDPRITDLTIDAQFTGNTVYETICSICDSVNIGFRITLSDDNKFIFKLYSGIDRSYDQLVYPQVVFSPKFDNIISSNYIESDRSLKTVGLVAGEGEGAARRMVVVDSQYGAKSGLDRRELFIDARDLSSNTSWGELTNEEYRAQLNQRGVEKLSENIGVSSFEGQIDTTQMYKYGEDYSIGDIVQIINEYGMDTKSRIIEFIISQDLEGTYSYPTFASVI